MPIEVDLISQSRVILQTYTDPINNDDLMKLRRHIERDIVPNVSGQVHIIADFRGVSKLPVMILTSGSGMLRTSQMNTGTIVFVTENAFIDAMARAFKRLSPHNAMEIVSTLDEAFRIVDLLALQSSLK